MKSLCESILDDEDVLMGDVKKEITPQNTLIKIICGEDVDSIEKLFKDINLPKGGNWELNFRNVDQSFTATYGCLDSGIIMHIVKIEYYVRWGYLYIKYNRLLNEPYYVNVLSNRYNLSKDDYKKLKKSIAKKFDLRKAFNNQKEEIWVPK